MLFLFCSCTVLLQVIKLAKDTNYLHRMACLFCFNTLCEVLGADNTLKEILPVIQQVILIFCDWILCLKSPSVS